MRAADTNVLIRIITRDDPNQAEAAEPFLEKGAWVSILAVAETVWILRSVYGVDSRGLATAVEMLLDHKDLTVQDADVVAALSASSGRGPRLASRTA
jgi:predicted nucleic-acid-binding protein